MRKNVKPSLFFFFSCSCALPQLSSLSARLKFYMAPGLRRNLSSCRICHASIVFISLKISAFCVEFFCVYIAYVCFLRSSPSSSHGSHCASYLPIVSHSNANKYRRLSCALLWLYDMNDENGVGI